MVQVKVKVNFTLEEAIKAQRRRGIWPYFSLSSALVRGMRSTQCHTLATLPPKKPGTSYIGGRVGPKTSWRVRKISPPPAFDPRTVQPVASRYTGYAIPAYEG